MTEESIILDFGETKLTYTGMEDGSAISIGWETPSHEKHYIVRSSTSFMQLSSYFANCCRKAESGCTEHQGM